MAVCFFKDDSCVDLPFVTTKSYPGGFPVQCQAQERDLDVRPFQGEHMSDGGPQGSGFIYDGSKQA